MTAELQAFVRESLARGVPRESIGRALREAGWRPDEIEPALAAWADVDYPIPVPRRRPYLSAREAFLYLVLFATLYTTAVNVGAVLFKALDLALPDPGQGWESARATREAVRGATAGLVIAFPIFLWLSAVIGREVAREPEKRGSRVRKWLTYLTLFVAAMVIIGDLTFLVSRLLSGELPLRVLVKTLVVLAIAGTVFGHYLAELRRDEREGAVPARELRVPPRLGAAAVVAVLVTGLVLSGSPVRVRSRQIDRQRIEDLRRISGMVTSWASDHERLPARLEDLSLDPAAQDLRITDPMSGAPYEYRPLGSSRYELCASFTEAETAVVSPDPDMPPRFWSHGKGRQCFQLSVPRRVLEGRPREKRVP